MPAAPSGPPVEFDDFENTPEYASLRTALADRDVVQFDAAVEALAPTEIANALFALAEVDGVETVLERFAIDAPASPIARTALAARYILMGWAMRSGTAEISTQQRDAFREQLRRAEALLIEVCAERPDFAPAWEARISTAMGFELCSCEATRRFDRLSAALPHSFSAQAKLLQVLQPKWGAEVGEAEAFVRAAVEAAPPGSNTAALVPLQQIERWLEAGAGEAGVSSLRQPTRLNELRAAARMLLAGDAGSDPLTVQAHSSFAMAFWLGGHHADAAPHFERLGGRVSSFPWVYSSGGAADVADARTKALAAAGTNRSGRA